MVGIRIYNDQYFKSKFGGVKLLRRGACFFVDYCVEEPLIKSLDCDYKKFVMDADGSMRCGKKLQQQHHQQQRLYYYYYYYYYYYS